MQQVGAKAALGHQLVQVLVGGGKHAHVHADQFATADAEELALGQHPQQARLQRRRHVADLVQEQRAAVRLLEAPDVALAGAGEGARLVAEQLRLQQFSGDRRGVERDEWAARAWRFAVQRARHQFLAGAGLTRDQHADRRLRQSPDRAEQLAHGRRAAEQFALRAAVIVFFRRRRRRRLRQGARRQRDRVVEVEGLGQEIVGAAAEGAGGAGDIGVGQHHHHRQLRPPRLQCVQEGEAVEAGHAHVGEHQVGPGSIVVERGQRGARAVEALHAVAGIAQRLQQHEAHRMVVVHHPHAGRVSGHRRAPRFRRRSPGRAPHRHRHR